MNREHSGQIDYINVSGKWKCFLKNSRSYNSLSIGSNHSLVMATFLTEYGTQ